MAVASIIKQHPNVNQFMLVVDMGKDKNPEDPDWLNYFIYGGMCYKSGHMPSLDRINTELYSTLFQFEDYNEIWEAEVERIDIDNTTAYIYLKQDFTNPKLDSNVETSES